MAGQALCCAGVLYLNCYKKESMIRKLAKIALAWLTVALVLPAIMTVLLTPKPVEAG